MAATPKANSESSLDLLVPEMHCAACMQALERGLTKIDGVRAARANLTARRLSILFDERLLSQDAVLAAVADLGFAARPVGRDARDLVARDEADSELLRALGVAGFAAANVMLLSVSVWSGAEGATRDLFHWISALIAVPAVAYAGRPFFRSAAKALSAHWLNMDVPIALAILTATAMSLVETVRGGDEVWFEAALMLLFFLLAGRFLDHRMRNVARSAAARLLSLTPDRATRLTGGSVETLTAVADIVAGDTVLVRPGERVPLDGVVTMGASDVDRAMLTGEPLSDPVAVGHMVHAGTMNLTGLLRVRITKAADDTLLADIARLMAAAEQGRGRFVRFADQVARLYAPIVHLLALATLIGWLLADAGWHAGLMAAVAVLIITCPCALGLAVPVVQVAAVGLLFRQGVLVKDGAALERLAGIDTVVFDKTGTLTKGAPVLVAGPPEGDPVWALAAAAASASRHPLAQALLNAANDRGVAPDGIANARECPGAGVEAVHKGRRIRLGRRDWAAPDAPADAPASSEILFACEGEEPAVFLFEDEARDDAGEAVARLRNGGLQIALLSGDRPAAVGRLARRFGIEEWRADCRPQDKLDRLATLAGEGRRVLMVGDGINDAPALAAADVSMTLASASDVTHAAADIVITSERLQLIPVAWRVARKARALVLQNVTLALVYNLVAVPLAMAGLATPLIAAVAMSSSSILVTANALRLRAVPPARPHRLGAIRGAGAVPA